MRAVQLEELPSDMHACQLEELPVELLDQILRYITDRPSLCHLAVTSRTLHTLVTPLLYEHFLMDRDWSRRKDQRRQLRALTELMLRRPDGRATLVRRLTLVKGRQDTVLNVKSIRRKTSRKEKLVMVSKTFEEAARAMSANNAAAERWIDEFSRLGKGFPVLALLLPRLTHLEELCLYPDFSGRLLEMLVMISRRAPPFDAAPALQNLQWLCITNIDELHGITRPGTFTSLLQLPALQAVLYKDAYSSGFAKSKDEDHVLQQSEPSGVKRLELAYCSLDPSDMDFLLSKIRALENFAWDIKFRAGSSTRPDAAAMRRALQRHRDTLHTLWLSNRHYGYLGSQYHYELILPMKGFADFHRLKRLNLDPLALFGHRRRRRMDDDDSDDGTLVSAYPEPEWDLFQRRRLRGMLPPNCEVFVITSIHYRGRHTLKALTDLLPERPASLRVMRLVGEIKAKRFRKLWPAYADLARQAYGSGLHLDLVDGEEPHVLPHYKGSWAAVDREMWAARGTGPGEDSSVYYDGRGYPYTLVRLEDLEQWMSDAEKAGPLN